MKKILLLGLMCLSTFLSFAQNIIGKVTDVNGDPILGATIKVKGTQTFTTSDFDGKYTIKAKKTDYLIFSYTGYDSEVVKVGDKKVINVKLQSSLEEVVVQAYRNTTIKRSVVASSIVTSRQFESKPNSSIVQTLQGQVAGQSIQTTNGYTVNTSSGQPGAHSNINIRGVSSINGNTEPLIVLDGVPVNEDVFRTINPDSIKSTKVLKDASATAMYGNRGVNGVIVISTTGEKQLEDPQLVIREVQTLFEQYRNNESYKEIEENPFEQTTAKPLSTFSIDVDKASYANVRRMINNGEFVNPHAVKIEEMINYFNYEYAQPTGKHPFNVETDVIQTPWNKDTQLVKIGLKGKEIDQKDLPASNLTFLIDVSGSMGSTNKLPLLKRAFQLLVNQMRPQDKVAIVVYAGAAGMVLEPTTGSEKEKIYEALENLNAGGSTAGGAGIELAYKIAQENFIKNGNNRVILATDGDFNVGASSDQAMEDLVVQKRESGVFLSVLGFGMGNYKDSKLETLADKGNGNHAYIDTIQEARRIFVKEFSGSMYAIAKDVKIQVEFNPNNVSAYRLIGYENRMLATQDFVDDKKDAGELGMGHTVTALFEVVPKGVDSGYLKEMTQLKYTDTSYRNSLKDELFTVKLRYKKPDGNKSIPMEFVQKNKVSAINEDVQFAAAVALFGMKLRKSDYSNQATLDDVISLAQKGRGKDADGYRAEFIRLVKSYRDGVNNQNALSER
ncbi:VWA domain-containing protein [Nonlabens spongiae]|uniref:VWA domain-containing protein n=1 Tax=Nonlabens spongiae TaxID=331648 RepID=A0A1W6MJL9_9FLAO|nr:VWA domain-containing protein [Nonlabens spongiae]ARN77808.1 VWA domain-containing protein [Nonlabens spongiae]